MRTSATPLRVVGGSDGEADGADAETEDGAEHDFMCCPPLRTRAAGLVLFSERCVDLRAIERPELMQQRVQA